MLDASPAAGIKKPGREVSRDRTLTDEELAAVWHACDGLSRPFDAVVRLLLVTGARREEIAALRWSEIDLAGARIVLPGERTKTGKAHEIPLSPLALATIEALPRIGDGFVFPASRRGSTNPASGYSAAKRKLDELSGVMGWRPHDIRRTVATGLQRLGTRLEVTEAVLGHTSGSRGGIVGVYQRHTYGPEKRLALDAWAHEVERLTRRAPDRAPEEEGFSLPLLTDKSAKKPQAA